MVLPTRTPIRYNVATPLISTRLQPGVWHRECSSRFNGFPARARKTVETVFAHIAAIHPAEAGC